MAVAPIPPDIASRYEQALEARDLDGVLAAVSALQAHGHSRVCEGWLEQARDCFPDASRVALRLLELQLRYRSWDAFDATATTALARYPESADIHYTVGCGHEGRGMWTAAARSFGRAAELEPDEVEPVLRQVRSLRIEQHRDEAMRVLKAALRRHPDAAPVQAAIGYTLIELDRPMDAARRFQKAVALQPDWPTYKDDLAGALMLAERWDEAARAAMQSLEGRKKNERAWTVFAIANAKLGDRARAEQGHKNAIRSAKDPSRAQGNFGLFLAKDASKMLEAVRMLKTARVAHPDWPEVCDALDRLLDQ